MTAEEEVLSELLRIRKSRDGLTVSALASSPTITALLGNGDPYVAYTRLQHVVLDSDLDMSIKAASASIGLLATGDTLLDRLDEFGDEYGYEQRQARRYSDRGLVKLARLVVTNWALESSPSLHITVVANASDEVSVAYAARCPLSITMRAVALTLSIDGHPRSLPQHETVRREEGGESIETLVQPILVAVPHPSSLSFVWKGEVWPRFRVTFIDAGAFAMVVETLGNRASIHR